MTSASSIALIASLAIVSTVRGSSDCTFAPVPMFASSLCYSLTDVGSTCCSAVKTLQGGKPDTKACESCKSESNIGVKQLMQKCPKTESMTHGLDIFGWQAAKNVSNIQIPDATKLDSDTCSSLKCNLKVAGGSLLLGSLTDDCCSAAGPVMAAQSAAKKPAADALKTYCTKCKGTSNYFLAAMMMSDCAAEENATPKATEDDLEKMWARFQHDFNDV